jgi:signal transduction histidine kinase
MSAVRYRPFEPWTGIRDFRGEMMVLDPDAAVRLELARELHDRVSPQLTGILMRLESVKANSAHNPYAVGEVIEVQRSTREVLHSLRDILSGLRDERVDDPEFAESVREIVRTFERRSGIQAHVYVSRGFPSTLPERLAHNLRRVIGEALANVLRHSGARRVSVRLQRGADEILVRVRDDGIGLEVFDPNGASGFGLRGMRERATLIDGKLSIRSRPGRGTTVELRVPVERAG